MARKSPSTGGRQPEHRARIVELAVDLFDGDRAAAHRWLKWPARAFGGQTPWDVAETEKGSREVENLIGRLNHGVFN
jgi:putative toxin-antitoxin system antitoxin component (TIGR02293 family)